MRNTETESGKSSHFSLKPSPFAIGIKGLTSSKTWINIKEPKRQRQNCLPNPLCSWSTKAYLHCSGQDLGGTSHSTRTTITSVSSLISPQHRQLGHGHTRKLQRKGSQAPEQEQLPGISAKAGATRSAPTHRSRILSWRPSLPSSSLMKSSMISK